MGPAILEAAAATSDEVVELRTAVTAAAKRLDTVILQARMHQVRGARPIGSRKVT